MELGIGKFFGSGREYFFAAGEDGDMAAIKQDLSGQRQTNTAGTTGN